MASNEYRFVTQWTIPGTREQVCEVLSDAEGLARWWPDVYLAVRVLERGDARGLGKRVELHTKGFLPYTLRWQFVVTENNKPEGFALRASGDLEGEGRWRFTQRGDTVDVEYDWRIKAEKPLLRWLSPLLKPLFAWNHRWAMARGEQCLRAELRSALSAGRIVDGSPTAAY